MCKLWTLGIGVLCERGQLATIHRGLVAIVLFGGGGADTFVFADTAVRTATPPPATNVIDYHLAESDKSTSRR